MATGVIATTALTTAIRTKAMTTTTPMIATTAPLTTTTPMTTTTAMTIACVPVHYAHVPPLCMDRAIVSNSPSEKSL